MQSSVRQRKGRSSILLPMRKHTVLVLDESKQSTPWAGWFFSIWRLLVPLRLERHLCTCKSFCYEEDPKSCTWKQIPHNHAKQMDWGDYSIWQWCDRYIDCPFHEWEHQCIESFFQKNKCRLDSLHTAMRITAWPDILIWKTRLAKIYDLRLESNPCMHTAHPHMTAKNAYRRTLHSL